MMPTPIAVRYTRRTHKYHKLAVGLVGPLRGRLAILFSSWAQTCKSWLSRRLRLDRHAKQAEVSPSLTRYRIIYNGSSWYGKSELKLGWSCRPPAWQTFHR